MDESKNQLSLEKTIFSLFPPDSVEKIDLDQFKIRVDRDTVLIHEGSHLDFFLIPVDVEVLTVSRFGSENSEQIGTTHPGRSVNLYSFLKSLPSPYSVIAKTDGEILKIPKAVMDELFRNNPSVLNYLEKILEDQNIQVIVNDLKSIGIQSSFILDLVSNLDQKELIPHQFLEQHGTPATSLHYLVEGHFLIRPAKSVSGWSLPLKSWVGWKELIDKTSFGSSILSLRRSKVLSIPLSVLQEVQEKHPEDFKRFDDWQRQADITPIEVDEDSEEQEEVEMADLFEEAARLNERHLQYPFVLQHEMMDCGPACLSMISLYFKKDLSVQFWRSKLSTNQDGTTLYDLAKTAEANGFISHCLEVKDLNELDDYLFPFIALRKFHYLVIYKVDAKFVTVGDPACGIRKMTLEDFYSGFEPVGLFLKPNTEFSKIESTQNNWQQISSVFTGLEKDFLLALICSVLGVSLSLVPPLISQVILDEVLVQKNLDYLWYLCAGLIGATLTMSFVNWAEKYYLVHVMNKFNFRATSLFVKKMFSLPYNFFATRHVSDFTHRIEEMAHLRNFVTKTLVGVFLNFMTLFIFGITLFFVHPKMAMYTFVAALLLLVPPILSSRYMTLLYNEIFSRFVDQMGYLNDLIKGVSYIKTSGSEWSARFRFENRLLEVLKSNSRFAMFSLKIETITMTYYHLANVGILCACVYHSIQGEMSIGKVVSFTLLTSKIFGPILELTKQWDQFIVVRSLVERLNDIFLSPSESTNSGFAKGKLTKDGLWGEIEFKDVWFRYGGESTDWVLKGLNFKIEAGQKIAVVGPTGSGKSTLANLLLRMYDPTKGQILIDGKDYRTFDIAWLRKQIGLLHQESHLFAGTVGDNISFTDLNADEDKIKMAGLRSAADEFINKKDLGYNYFVPHGGFGFSGGEKQKIALARLLFQKPTILILDEATSALDGISEAEVLGQIKRELRQNTVLSIAHRYTTVLNSDLALVLNEGKVAGYGTLDFLKETNPVYQKLFGLHPDREQAEPRIKVA